MRTAGSKTPASAKRLSSSATPARALGSPSATRPPLFLGPVAPQLRRHLRHLAPAPDSPRAHPTTRPGVKERRG